MQVKSIKVSFLALYSRFRILKPSYSKVNARKAFCLFLVSNLYPPLARMIGSLPPAELPLCKPKLPQIADGSTLTDFHGPKPVLLFNLIGASHTTLIDDSWSNRPEYAVDVQFLWGAKKIQRQMVTLRHCIQGLKMTQADFGV